MVNHYYKLNQCDSLFHSEFGVSGLANIESLKKFISQENQLVTDMNENLVWRHHGEWWDMLPTSKELFGELESLDQFVKVSQFIQAEGIRYILEANRRRKFKNSGSIIWQFNEPWPNVSCTSLVDYYQQPKMAYYWVKDAFAPLHVSLKYDKLFYLPEEEFKGQVFIHNSLEAKEISVKIEVLDVEGKCLYSDIINAKANTNRSALLKELSLNMPECKMGVFFIRLKLYRDEDIEGIKECTQNLYMYSQKDNNLFSQLFDMKENNLQVEKSKEGYLVRNTGKTVQLFVHGIPEGSNNCIFIEGNYSSLFPGEERLFKLYIPDNSNEGDVNIIWKVFNSLESLIIKHHL
jgi:beta-mannosidase